MGVLKIVTAVLTLLGVLGMVEDERVYEVKLLEDRVYVINDIDFEVKREDFHREIIYMETTAYTAECEGCIGITRAGLDVRGTITHQGYCIIATDPDVIPLGSLVEIEGETCLAADTGGAITGNRIDRLMWTKSEAFTYGRRYDVPVEVVGELSIVRED